MKKIHKFLMTRWRMISLTHYKFNLAHHKIQIKTVLRSHLSPIRLINMERLDNIIFWQGCEKIISYIIVETENDTNPAVAESLQSCPTLCDPTDGSPLGSPVPGILQARTVEWVAISFSNAWQWKVKVKSLSRVRLLATPWTAAHQAPPSMGFSRQEYWSGVPLPSPVVGAIAAMTALHLLWIP